MVLYFYKQQQQNTTTVKQCHTCFPAAVTYNFIFLVFDLLLSTFHRQSVIIYCEAKKDENIAKFSDDLNSHINGLQVSQLLWFSFFISNSPAFLYSLRSFTDSIRSWYQSSLSQKHVDTFVWWTFRVVITTLAETWIIWHVSSEHGWSHADE